MAGYNNKKQELDSQSQITLAVRDRISPLQVILASWVFRLLLFFAAHKFIGDVRNKKTLKVKPDSTVVDLTIRSWPLNHW